jgi:hypothetical protein
MRAKDHILLRTGETDTKQGEDARHEESFYSKLHDQDCVRPDYRALFPAAPTVFL